MTTKSEHARAKADRLDQWAAKRKKSAEEVLVYNHEHYTSDIAFNTQPGYFPLRDRVLRQNDRARASLRTADAMARKADWLRTTRSKGSRDADRQALRESVLLWLQVDTMVKTTFYGVVHVLKINRKTAKVASTGGSTCNIPLEFISKGDTGCLLETNTQDAHYGHS